jgi:hypothetical protein
MPVEKPTYEQQLAAVRAAGTMEDDAELERFTKQGGALMEAWLPYLSSLGGNGAAQPGALVVVPLLTSDPALAKAIDATAQQAMQQCATVLDEHGVEPID